MSKLFLVILFLIMTTSRLCSQSGTIKGKVTESSDGSPLWGTNIILAGSSIGTTTDKDGKYRLTGIPEGKATIIFSYLGYLPDSVEVNVAEGKIVELDVVLNSFFIEGEEVVVTEILQGQTAAINQQISSNTIVNIISSDKIQELPDANVSESLGRLPGISVQRDAGEGSKVVVRGLSPKFNSVTVNGERIPATDPNDRSVDLSMISQDILAGIEVFKALTPDMDGDAIGGSINLVTKNAPGQLQFNFRGQMGYNNHEKDYGNYKFNLSGSNRFFDKKFGVLADLAIQNVNRSSDLLSGDYNPPTSQIPQIEIANLNLVDKIEVRDRYSAGVNLDYSHGNLNLRFNNFFSRTDRDILRRRKRYRVGEGRVEYDLTDSEINTSMYNANLNGDYYLDFLNIDWVASYSLSKQRTPYSNYGRFQEVGAYKNGLIRNQGPEVIPQFANNDLASTWFQYATFNPESIDERDLTAQININSPFSLSNNIAGYLKTGCKYRDKNRNRDLDEFRTDFAVIDQIAAANPGRWTLYRNTNILMENFIDPSFNTDNFLNDAYEFGPGLNPGLIDQFHNEFSNFYEVNRFVELSDYEAGEKIYAAYIMAEVNLFKDFMFLPGLRYEWTENDYVGKFGGLRGNLGQTGTVKDTTGGQKYGEVLPMIHLRYKVLNGFDVRMAYTESISRPDYFNLVPFENINEAEQTLARGNPDLQHTSAQNYDVFLSLYNRYGLFTAGVYYKKLKNIDYLFTFRETEGQYSNFEVTQPVNSLEGKVYGYEFDIQSNFTFFPAPFDGIIFNFNLSRIFSETYFPYFEIGPRNPLPPFNPTIIKSFRKGRLPGQAEWVWNLAFGYEKGGFSGRISFNHQGESTQTIGVRSDVDGFSDAFTRVDMIVSQKIWEGFSVFVNLDNLTNISEDSYLGTEIFPTSKEYFGWTLDVGVYFKF